MAEKTKLEQQVEQQTQAALGEGFVQETSEQRAEREFQAKVKAERTEAQEKADRIIKSGVTAARASKGDISTMAMFTSDIADEEAAKTKREAEARSQSDQQQLSPFGFEPFNLGALTDPNQLPFGAGQQLGIITPKHIGWMRDNFESTMLKKRLESMQELEQTLINKARDARAKAYGFSTGKIGLKELGVDEAEFERRYKVKPSDDLINFLFKNKPELLDDPVLEANATTQFAQMAAGVIGQIFGGERAAEVGAVAPGAVALGTTADLLAADIAEYKKRKDAVHEKNAEIMERHKMNLIDAYRNLDARTDASEQAYIQHINRLADRLYQESDQAFAQILSTKQRQDSIMVAINNDGAARSRFNTAQANQALSEQARQRLQIELHRQESIRNDARTLSLMNKMALQNKMRILGSERERLQINRNFKSVTNSIGSEVSEAYNTMVDQRVPAEYIAAMAPKLMPVAQEMTKYIMTLNDEVRAGKRDQASVTEAWGKMSVLLSKGGIFNPVELSSFLETPARYSPEILARALDPSQIERMNQLVKTVNLPRSQNMDAQAAADFENALAGRLLLVLTANGIGDAVDFSKMGLQQQLLENKANQ